MAETNQTPAERPIDFKNQGEQIGVGLTEPVVMSRLGKAALAASQEGLAWVFEFLLKNAGRVAVFLAKSIARGEDRADPVFRELTDAAVRDLVGAGSSTDPGSVGKQILNAMTGGAGAQGGGGLQPSSAGAEAFMETVMKLALEGYLEGSLFHALSLGYLEKFGELDDILANVLGIGRMSRAVMRPLLGARVVTPMQWQVNKTYRPELLSSGQVATQVARGRWSKERGIEELARQGWSNERIEALFNASAKFHSVADVDLLQRAGQWSLADGVAHLRNQGYDEGTADRELMIERLKRIAAFERDMAAAAVRAFVNRHITEGELRSAAQGVTLRGQELAQLVERAITEREFNIRRLSLGQAEAMVKSGVLNVTDYRRVAERDGYPSDDVIALELQLRYELDREKAIADHRAELEAQRTDERRVRDEERAKRRAEVEADRARARRGPLSTIERAVIRGKVPMSRLEEILVPLYDADTVSIIVSLVEDERLAYAEQQKRRDEAEQRGAARGVSVADMEAAVLEGVLTTEEYRAFLDREGFPAGDAGVLVATLAARIADRDEAKRQRDDAAARSKARQIDLGRFEQLVRRGLRSREQYAGLLADLGFDAGAVAAMVELFDAQLADDARARAEREAAEARLKVKGVSLNLLRRGVLLGVKTLDDMNRFLVEQGFTADAQMILMADLRADLADAEAARQRRTAAGRGVEPATLSLAETARAARLGVISPATYQLRLAAAAFTETEAAAEMELLLLEIAQTQEARAKRDTIEAEAAARGLSLAQVERAVKLGVESSEAYRAKLVELGYGPDDVDTLMAVLFEELAMLKDAERRRSTVAGELKARNLSLAQLEEAVTAELLSIEHFQERLRALGYGADDAELLTALLVRELEAKAAKGP